MSNKPKKINSEQLEAEMHSRTGGLVKEYDLDGCVQIIFHQDTAKIAVFVAGDSDPEVMKDFIVNAMEALMLSLDKDFTTYSEDDGKDLN